MKFVRNAESGRRVRMSSIRRRNRSPSPQRRIRRSSGFETCCSDRSKYGTGPAADHIDQTIGEVRGIQVEETNPGDGGGDLLDEGNDGAGAQVSDVFPVRREVLRHEHDLLGTELLDLVEDRLRRAAALRPAEAGDRAEATGAVASLGDLHVRPGGRRPGPRQVEEIERGHGAPGFVTRVTGTPKPLTASTSGSAAASSSP